MMMSAVSDQLPHSTGRPSHRGGKSCWRGHRSSSTAQPPGQLQVCGVDAAWVRGRGCAAGGLLGPGPVHARAPTSAPSRSRRAASMMDLTVLWCNSV